MDGAGLGMAASSVVRLWADLGYVDWSKTTTLAPTVGVGVRVAPWLEIESAAAYSRVSGDGFSEPLSGFGNVYLGARHLTLDGPVRSTVGVGVLIPTGDTSRDASLANLWGSMTDGLQHFELRRPEATIVVAPWHVETGERVVLSLDGALGFEHPTDGARRSVDNYVYAHVAPGVACRPSTALLLGLRAPMLVVFNGDDREDNEFVIEPFVRATIRERGFVSLRLEFPVDDPAASLGGPMYVLGGGVAL